MTGYTFEETMNYGFYDWTVIATRKATKTEAKNDWKGCEVSVADDGCPCCNCGETVAIIQTVARPRWSKSGKRMVEETETFWLCSAHA